MTKRRRKKKSRTNVTAHQHAMAKPAVASQIRDLCKGWNKTDKLERGNRLWDLTLCGCSRRGLAKALRQSPTSIRRHMELANLPPDARDLIIKGVSAKEILARKAHLDRRFRSQQRVARDRETGAISDEIADLIIEFCRAKDGVPEYAVRAVDLELLLCAVESHLSWFAARGHRVSPVAKRLGTKVLFKQTRPFPPPEKFVEEDHRAKWLAAVIWTRVQEQPIWETALKKAKSRKKELELPKPKRTPKEAYEEMAKHYAELSRPPAPRRY
jgi:hypothetical protein